MKTKDICTQYGFDQGKFEAFLVNRNMNYKIEPSGVTVYDSDVEMIVDAYRLECDGNLTVYDGKLMSHDEATILKQEDLAKKKELSNMLITSGFSFEGYHITKYSGYISGDDCVTIPRDNFWGNNKVEENLCGALVKIRRQALKELKEAAYALGCNAVIGVDFDYMTMDPQHSATLNAQVTVYEPYVICVTANGNAVVIEKEE